MRTSLLTGLTLAGAAALAVLLSPVLDLQIESVALIGAATGAVIALVPHTTPLARLGGALLGVVAALVGFALRAAVLPDSPSGRAVFVAVVVLLSTAVVALAAGRIALWAPLLGAAAFAGAYEPVYAAAPPELASTSVNTLTALLVALAVGHLATAWAAPRVARREPAVASLAGQRAAQEPVSDDTTEAPSDLDLLLGDEHADHPRNDVPMESTR